jgi:hypothetical protein
MSRYTTMRVAETISARRREHSLLSELHAVDSGLRRAVDELTRAANTSQIVALLLAVELLFRAPLEKVKQSDGLLKFIRLHAPSLHQEVQRCRQEHASLIARFDQLSSRLAPADLRGEVRRLVTAIRAHDAPNGATNGASRCATNY